MKTIFMTSTLSWVQKELRNRHWNKKLNLGGPCGFFELEKKQIIALTWHFFPLHMIKEKLYTI